jgi:hypothetical protein
MLKGAVDKLKDQFGPLSFSQCYRLLHSRSTDRKEIITSGLALDTLVNTFTYINKGNFDYRLQYQLFLTKYHRITIAAVCVRLDLTFRDLWGIKRKFY